MKRLVVASTNAHKVLEIRTVLNTLESCQVAQLPPGLGEPDETGHTFLENAILKAEYYSRVCPDWAVADDSGIAVDALGGAPGVHSARYAPDDEARNRKLLAALENVPDEGRGAEFVCALAIGRGGKIAWTVEQRVRGVITHAPAGRNGFGYDPIFRLPELDRTMGEIAPEHKNRISHRGRALASLLEYLAALG